MTVAERQTKSACEMSGEIKAGVFFVDDKRQLLAMLALLPDGPAILRIDPAGNIRALVANRRYFGVLRDIATFRNENEADARHTVDSLHAEYKARFNGNKSTTQLPPTDFSTYTERVMAHAASEFGVEFAEPAAILA